MRRRIRDKRDRVRQLRIFCEVVQHGSHTRAAERLGLTEPAVSVQLRELERELGAILFERKALGVSLTQAGERLHTLAGPLVRGVDALFDDIGRSLDAAHPPRVRLAVSSAGSAFTLPRPLKRFADQYPEVSVHLHTVPPREALALLLDEKVDFVLGTRDGDVHGKVDYHEMFTYDLVVITALGHALAGRGPVSLDEMRRHRAIVPSNRLYSRRFGEAAALQALDARIEVGGGWRVLKHFVEAGVGIAMVPDMCVNESDRLAVVALEADVPTFSYGAFTLRHAHLAPHARRLLHALITNVSEPHRA